MCYKNSSNALLNSPASNLQSHPPNIMQCSFNTRFIIGATRNQITRIEKITLAIKFRRKY